MQARVPSLRDSRVAEAREILRARGLYCDTGLFLIIRFNLKEVIQMSFGKECSFYRKSDTLQFGCGIGYCDLDCDRTTCDGDTHFCEKPDALRKYQ